MKFVVVTLWSTFVFASLIAPESDAAPAPRGWPWRNIKSYNLRRLSNNNDWRLKNVLAMVSNKTTCSGDFYFLLDASPSIGAEVFQRLKDYVKLVISMFSPSQVQCDDLNIGLVRFGSRPDILSGLVPPMNATLANALDDTPYFPEVGKSSLVRAFRLMSTPSIWQSLSAIMEKNQQMGIQSMKFARVQRNSRARSARPLDDAFVPSKYRRRTLVVFSDGNFGDSEAGMALATLGLSEQLGTQVIFAGIEGEHSPVRIRTLSMLASSPSNLYLLGSLGSMTMPAYDELSAWNFAAYLCYTLQKQSPYNP